MSLAEARLQLKNLVMVGSAAVPAVRAVQKLWKAPPSIPLPCLPFSSLGRSLASCRELLQGTLTAKHFEHLWAALWANASSTIVIPPVHCEAFGQRFRFWPQRSTALEASLRGISLQLNLPPSAAAFELLWADLKAQYEGQPGNNLPEEQLFCPPRFESYNVAPAALAPIHYSQDAAIRPSPSSPPADIAAARRDELAAAAQAWPQPTDASRVRETTQQFANRFWTQMNHPLQACAVCALPSTAIQVSLHNLREEFFQLASLHLLLSGRRYVADHSGLYPHMCPAGFIGLPVDTVLQAGVPVPLECMAPIVDTWLLHLTSPQKETWAAQAISNATPLEAPLCPDCASFLQGPNPRLPARALANGNLCLPLPPEIATLSVGEKVFLARGFTVRRLHSLPARAAPQNRQRALLGNTIAFPQNSADVFTVLPRHPEEAAELLTILFSGDPSGETLTSGPYVVRREMVYKALLWLQQHNPFYADISLSTANLEALPLNGVPTEFIVASNLDTACEPEQGPADALHRPTDSAPPALAAALLDVEGEDVSPLQRWQQALPRGQTADDLQVVLPHGNSPLSSSDPGFWTVCFPHLFPYGDGIPAGARSTRFPLRSWARHLLIRCDRSRCGTHWALDLDFPAVLFSVLHRQELLQAVHAKFSGPSMTSLVTSLQQLTPQTFLDLQSIVGDTGGVLEALRFLVAEVPTVVFLFIVPIRLTSV